jgi:serine/threonine protein kinase
MSWLEYIKNLKDNNEPTRLSQLQLMMKDALQGMLVLHKHHVQHRDIKRKPLLLPTWEFEEWEIEALVLCAYIQTRTYSNKDTCTYE